MNKTAITLAILIACTTISTPVQAITYTTYKGIIGGGAIIGALIGGAIYKKRHNENQRWNENKKKEKASIGATICSAAVGAVLTGLSLALLLYRFTPGSRFNQAEGIRAHAERNNLLQAHVNLNAAEVAQAANRFYRRYPLVYAEEEMVKVAANLANAHDLYAQAAGDAQDDLEFIARCNQARQATNQLNHDATERAVALRGHGDYQTQVANQAKERLAQEKIAIERSKAFSSERRAQAAEQKAHAATQMAANKARAQAGKN